MDLMTIDEVSGMLRISNVTVYRFLNKDKQYYDSTFPEPIRIGRSVVWNKKELEEWVSNSPRGTDKNHSVKRNLK